jgi:hypothetical protein
MFNHQCSESPGFSGIPGSSRICTAVAGPKFVQSCSTQTTFLLRVTSTSCGPCALPPREQRIVSPFARRVADCEFSYRYFSGSSDGVISQTTFLSGVTSRVLTSCSSVINVLPFFRRIAAHGLGTSYSQISLKSLSYSIWLIYVSTSGRSARRQCPWTLKGTLRRILTLPVGLLNNPETKRSIAFNEDV